MRRKPYTEIGIRRVPCKRCGKPSTQQWQICSLGGAYFGVCPKCDIALNALLLNFYKIPNRKRILAAYIAEQVMQLKENYEPAKQTKRMVKSPARLGKLTRKQARDAVRRVRSI